MPLLEGCAGTLSTLAAHLSGVTHKHNSGPRRRGRWGLFVLLCAVCLCLPTAPTGAAGEATTSLYAPVNAPVGDVQGVAPYAYAITTSTTGYDIMLADGVNKDQRIARVKVDSVFFADVTASLSADGTNVAFRVVGDRLGGSSLYSVNVQSGKYVQIASAKSTVAGVGGYAWSPAGNTLAYVYAAPALDPAQADDEYGSIYVFSVGFQAAKLKSSTGNDHLLGFASDGLGVYVARREDRGGITLEHLVYLPLSGDTGTVLLRSQPGLRYSHYALWAAGAVPKVAYLVEGDYSLAASNSNVKEVMPIMAGAVRVVSKAAGGSGGKLTRPAGMGLATSDTLGVTNVLLRRDAEDYTHLSWTADGSGALAGGTRSGAAWRVDIEGSRVALGTALLGLHSASYTPGGTLEVLADNPVTRLVTLDYATGKVAATKYVGASVKPGGAVVRLGAPYIQQVNDTADNADGNWACGPTSVAMSLAYYGKLEPWYSYVGQNQLLPLSAPAAPAAPAAPVTPGPTKAPIGVDFAPYVTSVYTNNGHIYSAQARDPRGNLLAGLYGTISPTGFADWQTMATVLQWHGLSSQYVAATWDGVVGALRRGHPVLLGNQLTEAGHILLVVGYTGDGNLIVNDPYGNKFAPGYGSNNGYGVIYPWKRATARRALEVIGVYPPPKPTPTRMPTATMTATVVATFTATPVATTTSVPAPSATATPVP